MIGLSFIHAIAEIGTRTAIKNFPDRFPIEFNAPFNANHPDKFLLAQKYLSDKSLAEAFEHALATKNDELLRVLALRQAFGLSTIEFGGTLWTARKINHELERAATLADLAQLRFYRNTLHKELPHIRHRAAQAIILEAAALVKKHIECGGSNELRTYEASHIVERIAGMLCVVGNKRRAYQTSFRFLRALKP